MFSSGLFGGLINFTITFDRKNWQLQLFKNLFLGLGASILVPLFLEMISSDLINKSCTDDKYYFIFTGFCLTASIFSRRFISTVGDKVLREVQEAKQKAESAIFETKKNEESLELLIDSESEEDEDIKNGKIDTTDIEGDIANSVSNKSVQELAKDDVTKVLIELKNEKFKFRSIKGLASKSGTSPLTVQLALIELEKRELLRKLKNGMYWTLTPSGRIFFRNYKK